MLEEAVRIYYETKGVHTPNIYKNSLYENLQNDDQIHANVFIITIKSDSNTNVITAKLLSQSNSKMNAYTINRLVSYQLGGDGDKPLRTIINSLIHQPVNHKEIFSLSKDFLHKIINNVKYLHFDVISAAELAELVNEYNNT